MDDSALVEQIQRGDNGAFNVLMERWQSRIHRFAFRFFADGDEASQTPAKKLEAKELGEVLQKALLTLPDEQRVVIILKEYEGMKFREIAEILEEPENTVKSRMYYGLRSLRRVLKKWNIQNEYLNHD